MTTNSTNLLALLVRCLVVAALTLGAWEPAFGQVKAGILPFPIPPLDVVPELLDLGSHPVSYYEDGVNEHWPGGFIVVDVLNNYGNLPVLGQFPNKNTRLTEGELMHLVVDSLGGTTTGKTDDPEPEACPSCKPWIICSILLCALWLVFTVLWWRCRRQLLSGGVPR